VQDPWSPETSASRLSMSSTVPRARPLSITVCVLPFNVEGQLSLDCIL
jgi:hypothetical protein